MRKEGWEILYVGSKNGLETDIVPSNEIELKTVNVRPLPREISVKLLKSSLISVQGFWQALRLIADFRPDVVLGTGGFVAGPVVMAAVIRNIPVVIHEQNVYPGITNRLLARMVDKVALNFSAAREYFPRSVTEKFVVTGNPVRENILKADKNQARKELKLERGRQTLLVFGGSRGASSINRAMIYVCQQLQNEDWLQIIYITGKDAYEDIKSKLKIEEKSVIKIFPYLHQIEWAYAAADLIVNRAGATGLAEITARGLPAILIPYPYATGNHQYYNASILEAAGAAEIISDEELTGELLTAKIVELLQNEEKLHFMQKQSQLMGHPGARDDLVKVIKNLVAIENT
ncbi:MAG: undecaprenyldiphospho-muramoylpentapeptide beta-N-acetylglucosaminyltransferase, partial [Halanaerobiales bacterium]